ncbi:MAG: hypothetical protein ABIU05_20925 [Nitrospirales bacterium]
MRQNALTSVSRPSRRDDVRDHCSPFLLTQAASDQKPDKSIDISLRPLNSDEISSEDLQTDLSLEEVEEILIKEYGPLTPWVSRKLYCDYGVRNLPKLMMIAPIAEELVHNTIVELWEKKKEKQVKLNDKGHVQNWLKRALKIALYRWAQNMARELERGVYSIAIDEDEYDLDGEITEAWDALKKSATLWGKTEEVFDRPDGDDPSSQKDTDELKAALEHLPCDMRKLVNQVYGESMSWQEASATLNVDRRSLEREVQRSLHTLRPHLSSYQPSRGPVRKDTRRMRKSFHCPVCETTVKRKKGRDGAVCSGCGIGIHKDQFVHQYSFRHA